METEKREGGRERRMMRGFEPPSQIRPYIASFLFPSSLTAPTSLYAVIRFVHEIVYVKV